MADRGRTSHVGREVSREVLEALQLFPQLDLWPIQQHRKNGLKGALTPGLNSSQALSGTTLGRCHCPGPGVMMRSGPLQD